MLATADFARIRISSSITSVVLRPDPDEMLSEFHEVSRNASKCLLIFEVYGIMKLALHYLTKTVALDDNKFSKDLHPWINNVLIPQLEHRKHKIVDHHQKFFLGDYFVF